MKRKMALDLGDVKVGIAFSDPLGIIAGGYETYVRTKNEKKDIGYILNLYRERDCDAIIIGLPLNMDGTAGERAQKAIDFGEKLSLDGEIDIIYQDERWSTVSAEKSLIEMGMRREKRKEVVDKVAATIILQSFLDKYNKKGDNKMSEELEYFEDEEIVTFMNEDGTETDYVILAEIDYADKQYAVIQPVEIPQDMDEDEVIVCEVVVNENGEEEMIFIEDDEIGDAIVEEYNKILESEEENND